MEKEILGKLNILIRCPFCGVFVEPDIVSINDRIKIFCPNCEMEITEEDNHL
jgi:sarcosine oxidase delta subunit